MNHDSIHLSKSKDDSHTPSKSTAQDPAPGRDVASKVNGKRTDKPVDDSDKPVDSNHDTDNGDAKSDSEAETVVLPGKEDASSTTLRKAIKHEGKDEGESSAKKPKNEAKSSDGRNTNSSPDHKRTNKDQGASATADANNSSNLSSTISSPVPEPHPSSRAGSESAQSRSKQSHESDSHSKASTSRKRKTRADEPEEKGQKRRQKREASEERASLPSRRDGKKSNDRRSESPPTRPRNRTLSHSTSQHGVHKRKKPPPLQVAGRRKGSEDLDNNSDDSDSTHHPPHIRRLISTDNAAISPAKMGPHKKQRDKNGRTWLARACAAEDVDSVKARLKERPDDLDIADNAGNTPLQIAALEGKAEIVQALLEAGCDITTKNIDFDTPLIDAVENGHLDVIRLLLKAGVDPRQSNAKGEEPLDLLDPEDDNYERIKSALIKAKEREKRAHASEDHHGQPNTGRKSVHAGSPRESPSLHSGRSPPPHIPTHRRRTARSEQTRNDLLWVNPTADNLREKAGMGDFTAVDHILNMKPMGDIEAVVAAAKGGHEVCLQLLIAMGKPEEDPEPLDNLKVGFNTPMLATIGRGNLGVIKLLLEQPGFDPTRKIYAGKTYHEIAKERQGTDWQEEYDMLRQAYDKARGRSSNGGSSPNHTRSQQSNREGNKSKRDLSTSSPHQSLKRQSPDSSTKDGLTRKKAGLENKIARREKDRDVAEKSREGSKKHLHVPSKTESREQSIAVSDREASPIGHNKVKKPKRSMSDAEIHEKNMPKPRKRLVSGKVLKDSEESKRRASLVSIGSSSSNQDHSKANSTAGTNSSRIKTEDTKERKDKRGLKSASVEPGRKRARPSPSPSGERSPDLRKSPDTSKKFKRQRVNSDGQTGTKDPNSSSSKSTRSANATSSSTNATNSSAAPMAFMSSSGGASSKETAKATANTSKHQSSNEAQVKSHGKSSSKDTHADDAPGSQSKEEKIKVEDVQSQPDIDLEKEREERLAKEREMVEQQLKEKAAREEAERITREQEEAARLAEEAERQARIAREEEEARLEKQRREEEEAQRLAEKERLRKEEHERQERRRAEQEERERQARIRKKEEEEQRRRDALPNALRILLELGSEGAKQSSEVLKWLPLYTATGYQLDPNCDKQAGTEQWITNIQTAPLLGITDLGLSQCKHNHRTLLVDESLTLLCRHGLGKATRI